MSSRGKRKSKAVARASRGKMTTDDEEPSFVEALWGVGWPIDAEKQKGAQKTRVSYEEACSRLFAELPIEGSDDGSRVALVEQSLLSWREDSLFVVCLPLP